MNMKNTLIGLLAIILVGSGIYFLVHGHTHPPATAAVSGCRAQTLNVGSSGSCVKDIQIMTNYMETAGLTECHFNGGRALATTGVYDAQTAGQVKVIQNWANCYYAQEGLSMRIPASGSVGSSTWTELCDFSYTSPKQSKTSTSPYTSASIAAGKNAHC